MLSDFIESTYKKYKTDTSTFIKWLSENGQKCGYKPKAQAQMKEKVVPAKAPRLKGKARKQTKQASTGAPATSHGAQPESKQVPSHELLPLATAIVKSEDPLITIPSNIIRAGLRAVSARKRCAAYYSSKTNVQDFEKKQKNEGHSYYISLMEEVIMTLQPRFAASAGVSSGAASTKSPSNNIEEIENRFASLEVEEPLEQTGTAEPTPAKASVETVYDVEPPTLEKDVEEEKLFAFFCLFDDLQRLRSFIQELWIEFAIGRIDLITASVTTNAGFQLAIRTQDEILVSYPECGDYQSVLGALMTASGTNSHEELEVEVDDSLVRWMFAPAHQILDSFCDVLKPKNIPLMKRGHFGVYNPGADRAKMSDTQRQAEDMILLIELLPEFAFIQRFNVPVFAKDELTRGLVKMVETKQIPIWLTFATTVFLDIHHMMRGRVDIAFHQLQIAGTQIKSTLARYFELSSSLPAPSTWPKSNEKILQRLSQDVDNCILKDIVFPLKVKYYKQLANIIPGESERFYLLKRQPILCGILAFRAILELQYAGVSVCNAWGTVLYPAKLYNALRKKENPIKPWPMLDQVIALHTEERIYVGTVPKDIHETFRQVALILGYSASAFASNRRRQHKTPHSKTGPRGLKDSHVLGNFFRADLAGEDPVVFDLQNVEELLNEEAKSAELASDPKNKALRREWATTKRLTPLQLLQALKQFLPIELPKLKFDYFAMHEQSVTFLRRLRTELDADLLKYIGALYIENESELPFVGLYVILIADGSTRTAETLKLDGTGSLILEKAGRVLEEFIDEQED